MKKSSCFYIHLEKKKKVFDICEEEHDIILQKVQESKVSPGRMLMQNSTNICLKKIKKNKSLTYTNTCTRLHDFNH